jgi:hypothetical protein
MHRWPGLPYDHFKVSVADWLAVPKVALIVTAPACAVLDALIAKLADVAPAEHFTEIGAVTADEELEIVTTMPPDGAGPVRVTLPIEFPPALTLAGLSFSVNNVGGFTVKAADWVLEPWLALIVAVVCVVTAEVLITNVTLDFPLETVIEAGTEPDLLLLDNLITRPPTGAGLLRVTVPDEFVPPVTEVGLSDIEMSRGGAIVSVAVFLTEPDVAVSVTVCWVEVDLVVTMNVAELDPD